MNYRNVNTRGIFQKRYWKKARSFLIWSVISAIGINILYHEDGGIGKWWSEFEQRYVDIYWFFRLCFVYCVSIVCIRRSTKGILVCNLVYFVLEAWHVVCNLMHMNLMRDWNAVWGILIYSCGILNR